MNALIIILDESKWANSIDLDAFTCGEIVEYIAGYITN